MVYKCFDKKTVSSGINTDVKLNEKLAEKLHKLIIRIKFKNRTVFSRFKDNI